MKKLHRGISLFLAVIMLLSVLPISAMASVMDNSPEYNEEILQALESVLGSENEAEQYYAVMERYGLLEEDGSFVENMCATIDGVEYTTEELCALLSGDYDGDKIAVVDGMEIKLDDLWNIIVIEGYIDYLRETYCREGEWTAAGEENYRDFLEQFTTGGVNLLMSADASKVGEYSGINHGALVSFAASAPVNNVITVTASLSAAKEGQEVSFDYETVSGSGKVVSSTGKVTLTAGSDGTAKDTFTVTCTPETVDTLIAAAPVWYLNVSNLKNASFAASERSAATIPFAAEPTVGEGKEVDRITGSFTKYLIQLDNDNMDLSSGQIFAINKGFLNQLSETALLSYPLNNPMPSSQNPGGLKTVTVTYNVKVDNTESILANSVTYQLKYNSYYMVDSIEKGANYVSSVALRKDMIKDNIYTDFNNPMKHEFTANLYFSDTIAPTVKSIYTPKATYTVGQTVPIVVEFSEPMAPGNSSITVNGTTVKAQESDASDRLTFPYPVKAVDSANPVVTAVTAKDVSDNALDANYKPNPDSEKGLVLKDAVMQSCLPEGSIADVSCTIEGENSAAPVLKVSLTVSGDKEQNAWLASDLDENKVSKSLFAAVKGFDKAAFTMEGETLEGATMTATFELTPVDTAKQFTVELYLGGEVLIGSLQYVTQNPAVFVAAGDITTGVLVRASDGGEYQYENPESPVIYPQDAPAITAVFSLADKEYAYGDTKLVTTLDSEGKPLNTAAHFAWSSSDTAVANIDAEGKITPTGKSGTVHFVLTALNGSADRAVTVNTDSITFGTGLTPFLMIPNKVIRTVSGVDVPLFWSSNIPDKDENAVFTVKVKNGGGQEIYATATDLCGITIPASVLTFNYEEDAVNVYTVTVSITYNGVLFTEEARIYLTSPAAIVQLDPLSSLYMTDRADSVDIQWTIRNYDRYSATASDLFRLYITRNDQTVYENTTQPGTGLDGTYHGSYAMTLADVVTDPADPTSYRDVYTVSIQAKNGSDSTWSYDSYVLYVYDEDALKLWVNGERTGGIATMTNIPAISVMTQDQILALKRDISLKAVISANYGDFAWSDLSDRIAWSSSDPGISDINYRQGSYYASINSYTYTSYRPATEFLLSGLKTGTAQISATHVLTGMADSLQVSVDTLKDKLYLFSCTPAVPTTAYYTDGNGQEKTALSNDSGEFAIYEESGIDGDVYFVSSADGFDYFGTYFRNAIVSGETDPTEMSLYPCNNLIMRRAAYASVYLKNPDGTPYRGNVVVRGGVYVNGEYVETAQFGYGAGKSATHKGNKDTVVTTDDSGKLTVVMDSTQWGLDELGLTYADAVAYDFVVKPANSTAYYPLLIHIDATENEEIYIRSGEAIATFRKNTGEGEHPFVLAAEVVMKNDELGYSTTENILDSTDCIGVSPQITEEDVSVSVMWWGVETEPGDEYSMALCTDKRYEISADAKTVSTDSLPFAGTAVTTVRIPFDTESAKACGIGTAPERVELQYGNVTRGENYSEEMSFLLADTTDTPMTYDKLYSVMDGINESLGTAKSSDCGKMNVSDDLMSLMLRHFSTTDYKPDKDHAGGFNMTVMPTMDPTTFIAYLGIGLSNMDNKKNVTGVYADGTQDSRFSPYPGLRELKWFFSNDPNSTKNYWDSYDKELNQAESGKTLMDVYYNVTGYLESRVSLDPVTNEWQIHVLSGGFDVGGGVGFVQYINTMVGPVPITAELRGGGTINISLDTLTMEYLDVAGDEFVKGTEFLTRMRIYFYFKCFSGLGWDYSVIALKIGLYGQINADLTCEWLNRPDLPENATYRDGTAMLSTDRTLDGQFITIDGQVGIEFVAKLWIFSYERAIYSEPFHVWKHSWNQWNDINDIWAASQEQYKASLEKLKAVGAAKSVNVNGEEMVMLDLAPTMENFDYLGNDVSRKWNSRTLAPLFKLGAVSDTSAVKMQDNVNPYMSPMLSDDGSILVYLSDAADDDAVHTAYALRTGAGYADKGFIPGNPGKTDTGNVVAGSEDFAVAAWSSLGDTMEKDAGAVVTPEDQIIMMESSEIYASVYESGTWNTVALTSNSTADIAPVVAVSGTRAIAAWRSVATTNVDGNIADFDANDSILYRVYDGGSWSEPYCLYNGTAGNVKALNAAMLPDGTAAVIYELDTDGMAATSADREILWALVDTENEVSRTVRATNDTTADENPQISATSVNGQPCFAAAWYSSYTSGEELKYDIHMADFTADGVIQGNLPQSLEKMIADQQLLITSDFRFTKGSDSIEDLALVWVERMEEAELEGLQVEYDILNSLKFYTDGDTRVRLTAAQELTEAPDSTLINSFDVVSRDNTATSVFLGTTYDPDRPQEKTGETLDGTAVAYMVPFSISAVYTAKGNYTDSISVRQVYADPAGLRCGANTTVAVTLMNEGINPVESVTVEIGDSTTVRNDLYLLPGDTVTLYVDYRVPADTVRDEDYTVTAKTAEATVSAVGTAVFGNADLEISSAKVVAENEGERTIEIKLNNNSDAKLSGSGKSVELQFFSDPTCEKPLTGLSKVVISDNDSLQLIDEGGYSQQILFDAENYLTTLQSSPTEIPEQGISVYVKAAVVKDGEECKDSRSASNTCCVLCENLMTRTGSPVSVKSAFKTADGNSTVTADIRNNRLTQAASGNVIATLFDENGNIIAQQQSYDPAETDLGLLTIGGEETKEVSFTFNEAGSYAEVMYTQLILDDGTDATLATLESTNVPGVDLSIFSADEDHPDTYVAEVETYEVESINMVVSPSDPDASVKLNGESVDGYCSMPLASGTNLLDFAVTSKDGTVTLHYILSATPHQHHPVMVPGQAPTEEAPGWKDYYECKDAEDACHKYFEDASGSVPIEQLETWKTDGNGYIAPLIHTITPVDGKRATHRAAGYKPYYECRNCGRYYEDATGLIEITDIDQWKAAGGNGYLHKIKSSDVVESAPTGDAGCMGLWLLSANVSLMGLWACPAMRKRKEK